ncbi:MAG: tetratricopeptide repeat protein [bacterium]|nr:tetratricopeptide repeat protein [bacterium]
MIRNLGNTISTPMIPVIPPVSSSARASVLDWIVTCCIGLGVFVIPLIFAGWTVDWLEITKQTLFIALTSIGLFAWLLKGVLAGRMHVTRNWIHFSGLLFVIAYLITSIFSVHRFASFVGNGGQEPWSFITVLTGCAFVFLMANEVRTTKQVYDYVFLFLVSALIVGIFGLCQLLGWFPLSWAFTHIKNFTTVGSIYSLASFLVIPLIMASAIAFHGCRDNVCLLGRDSGAGKAARVLVWAVMAVAFVVLILVDFWVPWAVLLVGALAIVLAGYGREKKIGHPAKLALPGVLVLVGIALLIFKMPLDLKLPTEVSPSFSASYDIAKQALKTEPLLGSGPGTWVYNYALLRSPGVNASPFWNIRFDRSISAFFTLLPTIGIVGMIFWLLFLLAVAGKSIGHLIREKNDDLWYASVLIFAAWIGMVVLHFLYNFNMAHAFLFWLLTGLLAGIAARETLVMEVNISSLHKSLVMGGGIVGMVACVAVFWMVGQRYAADVAFGKAVHAYQARQPFEAVIPNLERAVAWNGMDDGYVRNLAQGHLLKALSELQANPSADKFKSIQDEIALALDLANKSASMVPVNVDNWANLGMQYFNIASFTRGADEAAIKNYTEAIKREPQNPAFFDQIAQIFLLRADAYRTLLDTKDAKQKAEAKKNMEDNSNYAAEALKKSIALKSDYLPAHYHLAQWYERQGKTREAIAELTGVLKVRNTDVGVAFELAMAYYADQQKDNAIQLLEQIVKVDAKNVNARWYLALMYEEGKRLNDALAQFMELSKQVPDNAAVKQRLENLQKKGIKTTGKLEEPLPETVQDQGETNPIR